MGQWTYTSSYVLDDADETESSSAIHDQILGSQDEYVRDQDLQLHLVRQEAKISRYLQKSARDY